MSLLDRTALWSSTEHCCPPVVEDDGTIWAIWWSASATEGPAAAEVRYSDDYGSTWTAWASIGTESDAPYFVGNANAEQPQRHCGTIIRDSHGNVYYNCITGASPGVRGLGRVDADTKAVTKCFDFYVSSTLAGPTAFDTLVKTWGWTLDNSGSIYIGQYVMNYWNGSAWVYCLQEPNGHYIWKGDPTGTTWTRTDLFVTLEDGCRHCHSIHCDPNDNTLWVNIGDVPKVTYYSTDGLQSATKITSADPGGEGATGLTFTSERVYFGEDIYGAGECQMWRTPADGKSPLEVAHEWSSTFDVPTYYLRAVGDDEIWASIVNDSYGSDKRSALVRLTKTAGTLSPWSETIVVQSSGYTAGSALWSWDISHNARGVSPSSHPFMYVSFINAAQTGQELGVFRVERDGYLAATANATGITLTYSGTAPFRIERRVV